MATWSNLRFNIPVGIPSQRVEQYWDAYKRKAGVLWEKEGWKVLRVHNPIIDDTNLGRIKKWDQPDRDYFILWGLLERAPREHLLEMDDKFLPLFAPYGYKEK